MIKKNCEFPYYVVSYSFNFQFISLKDDYITINSYDYYLNTVPYKHI